MQTYFLKEMEGLISPEIWFSIVHQSLGFSVIYIYTLPKTYHFAPQKEGLFPQREGLNSSNSSDSGANVC